jgi:hypothetical protein
LSIDRAGEEGEGTFLDVHQSADEVSMFVLVCCVQFMLEVKNEHTHPAGESPHIPGCFFLTSTIHLDFMLKLHQGILNKEMSKCTLRQRLK